MLQLSPWPLSSWRLNIKSNNFSPPDDCKNAYNYIKQNLICTASRLIMISLLPVPFQTKLLRNHSGHAQTVLSSAAMILTFSAAGNFHF